MGKAGSILVSGLLAGPLIFGLGCVGPNVNPRGPKANKGYVDFYSPGDSHLYWSVKRSDRAGGDFKTVFFKLRPLPDRVLRLELEPGPQRFQITFLNRVIEAPAIVQVEVQGGKVTPVRIDLVPVQEASVALREEQFGANVRGAGRKTTYSTEAGVMRRIVVSVQPPASYQPKDQTHYPS